MEYWTMLLSIMAGLLGIHYYFRRFNFFKRNGILHVPAIPVLGNFTPVIFRRIAFADCIRNIYNYRPDAKYFGLYATTIPVILIRDPELIRDILIKNFDKFPNRRRLDEFNDTIFTSNLTFLRDQKWRDTRNLLSPAFTSGKMKSMYPLIADRAVDFTNALWEKVSEKKDMDMKDLISRYMSDVIATCAFGIKVNSMRDPTNNFYLYGKQANLIGARPNRFLFFRTFPGICKFLRLKFLSDNVSNYFKNTIKSTIAVRDAENITRPDMIQLMMDIRGKRENEKELTMDDMIAQAFAFFIGGFESSSIVMSFAAHEIGSNPDVQTKLRQEIDEALENLDGEVTYDTINQLKYLDAVVNEVLRLYPPVFLSERQCIGNYELPPTLPGEKPIMLKKGQAVWVSFHAIHRDEKYYDEPDKFLPERFFDKDVHNTPYYAPFGLGPRMCIANRFALLEIKVLIFHLLARCELKPCAKTTLPMKLTGNILDMKPKTGFWLNIERRKDIHPKIGLIMHNGCTVTS